MNKDAYNLLNGCNKGDEFVKVKMLLKTKGNLFIKKKPFYLNSKTAFKVYQVDDITYSIKLLRFQSLPSFDLLVV